MLEEQTEIRRPKYYCLRGRDGYTPAASSPILLPALSFLSPSLFVQQADQHRLALRGGSKKRICNRGSISILRICPPSHSSLSLLLLERLVQLSPRIRQVVSAKILHGWMICFETILLEMCVCVCRVLAPVFVLCCSNKVCIERGNFLDD